MRNSKVFITSLVAVFLHILLLGCIFYFSISFAPEKPSELIIYTLEASPISATVKASSNKNSQQQKIQLTTAEAITALPSAQSSGGNTSANNAVPFIAEYPYLSRQEGEEGKVILEYRTDDTGKVIYAKILESSGRPRLDSAAERSVRKNQFTPNTQKTLQIEFKLKENSAMDRRMNSTEKSETAIVAGGCFWGVQDIIRKIPGVLSSRVGYTGGKTSNPTYPEVKKGTTGHAEAVEILFDPKKVSYEVILDYFFRMHNPTTLNQQENDIGSQYRSAIFYFDEKQKKVAENKKAAVGASGKWKKPIVTEIVPAQTFYSAEDYHQDYLVKNPNGYTCHFLRD